MEVRTPTTSSSRSSPDAPLLVCGLALVALALAFSAWGLLRLNTWYLASDQFAFLTFADDLARGTVFHDDAALVRIQPHADPATSFDAFFQTYTWRDGTLFSRYPPGFPALLALAKGIGGEVAEHALNPMMYLALLLLLGALTAALIDEQSRVLGWGAAVAAVWLFLVLPTRAHLWGITVARDLPAHFFGLLALLAAVRRSYGGSGLALGLACTIRPDAALYLASLGAVFALQRPGVRRLGFFALAALLGASPLFAYNHAVGDGFFHFTQGNEFRELLSAWPSADGVVNVAVAVFPSGGAFRISHLAGSLPGNAGYLLSAFGWATGATVVGLLWSLKRHPLVAAALVPYVVVALLFYSCWSHPDPRYMTGVVACLVPLAALGAVAICAASARGGFLPRALVVLVFLGWVVQRFATGEAWSSGTERVSVVLAAGIGFAALGGSWTQRMATLFPALALAFLGGVSVLRSQGSVDPFRYPQVVRARTAVAALMPPGSMVVTTSALGRPAENLRHYSGLEAFYMEEVPLLGVNADQALVRFALDGRRVFYLLDARDRTSLARVSRGAQVREVERRWGSDLLDWYVDPRRAPRGAVLYELTLSQERREQIRRFLDAMDGARRERRRLRES